MKKGVVVLLVVVALIVLITPGIIGRLAEESIDQSLELAVTENEDLVVSSLGFVRGWFTSEGKHRIELRDRTLLSGAVDEAGDSRRYLDALIVTTRLDHGLIPVTSMAREEGSLAPGLGSAVSTLSAEVSDGTSFDIPGTIYSEVGLTGELQSNFLLDADSTTVEGRLLEWGDADVLFTSNPATGFVSSSGTFDKLAMVAPYETVSMNDISLDGEQTPGEYGYPLGFIDARIGSIAVQSEVNNFVMGPIRVASSVDQAGDHVDATASFEITNFDSPIGATNVNWQARILGADGAALGEAMKIRQYPDDPERSIQALDDFEAALEALLAAGLEVHFDRFDVSLPQGSMSSNLHLTVHETAPDNMSWAAAVLALDGTVELSMTQGLVDMITGMYPEFGGAVALGYLRKSGDLYETLVEIRSGVLTINGAPMNIPLELLQ